MTTRKSSRNNITQPPCSYDPELRCSPVRARWDIPPAHAWLPAKPARSPGSFYSCTAPKSLLSRQGFVLLAIICCVGQIRAQWDLIGQASEIHLASAAIEECDIKLAITRSGENVEITWTGGGVLQETETLVPAKWDPVAGNPAGKYITPATGEARFFRVACSPVLLSAEAPGASLEDGKTLLSAVSIFNGGATAADDVVVKSIKLEGGTLDSTELPVKLGTIPAQGSLILDAAFVGQFLPSGSHRLTIEGTYSLAAAIHDFATTVTVVIPPPSTGENRLGKVTVEANKVEGAQFPPRPPDIEVEKVNGQRWTIPHAPFVAGNPTPTPTGTKPIPGKGGLVAASPGPITFLANNGLGINTTTITEPSGASSGNVIFVTANFFAAYSTDGGGSWTQLNPTTVFPADAVGFCCDQVVQYVPSIDRFIWFLQGNGYRLATARPADIISSGGTAWTYWNLTPGVFGQPAGTGLDYPDLSVGNNSLYMSWDVGFPSCPAGCRGGFQVARISLAGIAAGGTITVEFTDPPDAGMAWGSHLMQNTLDEIFWAGHNSDRNMRVFSLAEGSGTYFWRDVGISSWARTALISNTPDGQNWFSECGGNFPGWDIIGATRSGNQLWFAWSAGTDRNFQQPHVEMVTLDRAGGFRVIQQVQIWNNSYAFGYPSLATAACTGEVGLSLEYGGGGNYENHVVGFWGDFVVYITTGSNVGTCRYGDYVTIRQAPSTRLNPGNLFTAFGYGINSATPPATGTVTDIRYVLFGRPSCQR